MITPDKMLRWLICALLTVSAFAQPGRSATPAETFYGMLLSISAADLTLDTGEDRPIHVQINSGTKYLSTMGKVKASDFEPGDKVTVEATHADADHYVSAAITLNKKGSAEDKQNAKSKLSPPAAPVARESAPAAPPSNETSSADRPRLNRTSSPVASAPAGNSSPADDSSTPMLRRSSPSTQSAPAQSAPPQRPSLSAEDVDGVTRMPVNPPPPSTGSDGSMRGSTGDDIIDQTREVAATFTQTLPNYMVKQFTTRYVKARPPTADAPPGSRSDLVTSGPGSI